MKPQRGWGGWLIHNKDEGLFAQEASEGSAAYKDWAHGTAVLVKAHPGWLNSL